MKQVLLLLLTVLVFALDTIGQKRTDPGMSSPQALHDQYIQQANNKKMLGFVMLTGGVALTVGGLAKMRAPSFEGVSKTDPRLLWLPVVGILSTAASFPMMKSSKRLREKAVMALDDESAFIGNQRLPFSTYPALSLKIRL
jgi:hypothetical protein